MCSFCWSEANFSLANSTSLVSQLSLSCLLVFFSGQANVRWKSGEHQVNFRWTLNLISLSVLSQAYLLILSEYKILCLVIYIFKQHFLFYINGCLISLRGGKAGASILSSSSILIFDLFLLHHLNEPFSGQQQQTKMHPVRKIMMSLIITAPPESIHQVS